MPFRRNTGFTLVELMITVAVLAVMLAIGFPSFQSVLRSNRIATATNEMIASMSLARSEAIKNTHGTGVCASTAGASCDGASWGDGWLVWDDTNGDGALDDGETVLRFTAGNPKVSGDDADLTIAYDARGRRRAAADQVVMLRPDECGSQPLQRSLLINRTGQIKVTKGPCP